ncbi:hypothetical protein SAMN05444411_103239 [Lutibacter oricola]|uniref:Uncharacterized protein n=1 Tax=Lutibacter oricola TaxID=762486 RepID=A0A1H2ZFY9_9FLAO|nr:hypothetical protein [Lutibacter oricola]SDX16275.1 hypothetical protein SAMN05444411_103239 [Lutibacter oricola]
MRKFIILIAIFTLISCSNDDSNISKPKGQLSVNNEITDLNYAYLIIYFSLGSEYQNIELYFSDKPILFEDGIVKHSNNTKASISLFLDGLELNPTTIENEYPFIFIGVNDFYNNPKPYLSRGTLRRNITYVDGESNEEKIIKTWKYGNVSISKNNDDYIINFELENDNIFLTGNYKGQLITVN